VSITVDSCLYYHVVQPHLTYFRVDNVEAALIKATGGIIKNTVAAFTFQDLLEKKTEISEDVENQVKPIIKDWGIAINSICLKSTRKAIQISESVPTWSANWSPRPLPAGTRRARSSTRRDRWRSPNCWENVRRFWTRRRRFRCVTWRH
jgi:hypothetical protein